MPSVFRCSNPKPGERYHLFVAVEDREGVAAEAWADDLDEAKAKALLVLVHGGQLCGELPRIPDEYKDWFQENDLQWAKKVIGCGHGGGAGAESH